MAWDSAFQIVNLVVFVAWVCLLFAPKRELVHKIIMGGVIVFLCLFYSVLVLSNFFLDPDGGFASLAQVQSLFKSQPIAVAGWIHYLAFDLFVGLAINHHAVKHGFPNSIRVLLLIATFMFGPIGLIMFLAIRWLDRSAFLKQLMPANNSGINSVLIATGTITLLLLIVCSFAFFIDQRTFNGINIWIKPIKFNVSMFIYVLTFAWAARLFPATALDTKTIRRIIELGCVSGLFEIVYISAQAARGRASHFNYETYTEGILYVVMGIAATAMVASTLILGLQLRKHAPAFARRSETLGMSLGLIIGSIATFITAMTLGAGIIDGPGHWIGGIKNDQMGIWLVGWSSTGGDLRVSHFFATHLMQALPFVGLLVDRLKINSTKPLMFATACGGTLLVVITFTQALMGRSLLGNS
jgi:hypothetical protein